MTEPSPVWFELSTFLLNYLLHSTLFLTVAVVVIDVFRRIEDFELRVLVWKLALTLPVLSAAGVTLWNLPHWGPRVPLSRTAESRFSPAEESQAFAGTLGPVEESKASTGTLGPVKGQSFVAVEGMDRPWSEQKIASAPLRAAGESRALESPSQSSWLPAIWIAMVVVWWLAAGWGISGLVWQWLELRRLRRDSVALENPEVDRAVERLRTQFGIRRPVAIRCSSAIRGPMTAGILHPFILLPAEVSWDNVHQRDALLAHELVHCSRRDAVWNLVIQGLCRVFPFQPLNWKTGRRLRTEMDFVADARAAWSSAARLGLAQSLIRFGEQQVKNAGTTLTSPSLAAYMASFDSPLGRRIELLLEEDGVKRPATRRARAAVVMLLLIGTGLTASFVPRAVAENSPSETVAEDSSYPGTTPVKKYVSELAILAGLAGPVVAEEPKAQPEASAVVPAPTAPLKTTADPLPEGIRRFNGMLVGQLAAKDMEKGTFLVRVDAVPRVWENSKAEDPRSVIGKTLEISGVFGKFLDVLVVTRAGETVEFECKYDGERLVFPGELLRKVAAYDPADYPVLPENFRGFRGVVAGKIAKKDPETFELILDVDRVVETSRESTAKDPRSIEGKSLMLAGFWNRKDAFHALKAGDSVNFGVQHIGLRGDHLTVANPVRQASETPKNAPRETDAREDSGLARELRGFRGMLVGKLVEKDIERGTFTITVDAVPRVWNNNRSTSPKSFRGQKVTAEGVTGKMLDALVVARAGDTIEFGAIHDSGDRMRVGEVLRKVAPVQPGDYPELPDDFRGFKGLVQAKVIQKDEQLMDMVVEITEIKSTLPANKAKQADSILGKRATLAGFWQRKDAFNSIGAGDMIECGVEHPQLLSDHLIVIESVKKVAAKD